VDFVVGLHGVGATGGIASEFYITLAAGGAERHSFFLCVHLEGGVLLGFL
jgi:hypothetical protein